MKKALLLVDIQNDYFPNGRMSLEGTDIAGNNAKKLLEHFRETKETIIHIQHISKREGATFFLPNTIGVEIHKSVKPLEGELVIQKNFPNSFLHTPLLETLRRENIEELIICGMMSHMCIDSTTRAAADLGFSCKVMHDACTTKKLKWNGTTIKAEEVHHSMMAALHGLFAQVLSTEEYLNTDNN